jgi:hypothetical protein
VNTLHTLDPTTVGLGEFGIDPRCRCGGEWIKGDCMLRNTFYGASWELNQAALELWRAIAAALENALRRATGR